MKGFFYFFFLLLFTAALFKQISAQSNTYSIKVMGTITDSMGKGINNASIKISYKKNNKIIRYENLYKDTSFVYVLTLSSADTLVIDVTHISYKTSTIYLSKNTTPDSCKLTITLYPKTHTLDEVTVKAPPVWVRGDTTFHKVSAFREGDERKLKDLLLKMPGFEFDDNGNLLYKRKIVEKVLIDGDEIFAEKVKLLINNFPIHVIDNVQALENQNSNRLLKGIVNENKVFLNLALNKSKIKQAFGTVELGVGSRDRYVINPVMLALINKLKIGYIGNANSVGMGMDWNEERELKPENVLADDNFLIKGLGFKRIANFDNRRYITNSRTSNNIQFNLPVKKNTKQKIEISVITDNQKQNSYYNSFILNDSALVGRSDSNFIAQKPLYIWGKYSREQDLTTSKILKTQLSFFYDGSQSIQTSNYAINNKQFQTDNFIKNNGKNFTLTNDFFNRVGEQKIIIIKSIISNYSNTQFANATTNNWADFFLLGKNYDNLNHQLFFDNSSVALSFQKTNNKNLLLNSFDIKTSFNKFRFYNQTLLIQKDNNAVKDTSLPEFSNVGAYKFYNISASLLSKIKSGRWDFSHILEGGYFGLNRIENSNSNYFSYPIFKSQLNVINKIKKGLSQNFVIGIEQSTNEVYRFISFLKPSGINLFNQVYGGEKPMLFFNSDYNISTNWPKTFNFSSLSVNYRQYFRSYVSANSLNSILQVTVDSFVPISTNQITINNSNTINKVFSKIIYAFGGGYTFSEFYVQYQKDFLKVLQDFYYVYVNAKVPFKKRYFLNFGSKFFNTAIKYPISSLQNRNSNFMSIVLELRQRFSLFNNFNIIVNTDFYNGNIGSNNQSNLFFADIELNWGIPSKHIFLYLKADNLFNQNAFYNNNIGLLSQSVYSLPIVGRNVMLTFKYEL